MTVDDVIGHFSLWGDFDEDEVTSKVGLLPSAVCPKGDTSLSGSPNLVTTWDIHCPATLKTAEEQIDHLLTLLWPHADVLRELTACFRGELNIVGAADLCLRPETMQKLAELHLTLNFFNYKNEAHVEQAVSA